MGFGWKLTISFFLLFLIGALCGVALTFTFAVSHSGITRAHAPRQWEDDAVRNLTNRLGLNPDHQNQARASLHDVITRIRTIQHVHQIDNIHLYDEALD